MAGFNTNALMPTPLPQQTNPLEFASQAIGVRNALLGNKIQQARYDADMAQGNALLGATGADGRTDYAKARAAMARDPKAAYGAAEAVRQQNAARLEDLSNTEAGKNAVGAILSYVGANPDQAHLYAAKRMAKAIFPGQNVDGIVNQIAQHPDGIAGGVAQLTNSMQAPGQQEANVYGTPGATVNNGQQTIIGTQQSAMSGGQFRPTTTVQQQTDPTFEHTYTNRTIMGPNGPVIMPMTQAQFDAYNGTHNGFTGRVDVTGSGSSNPAPTAIPVGAEEQAKTGLAVRNSLAGQQEGYAQNLSTLRNLDGLLSKIPADQRSRRLVEVENLLSKAGINFDGATLAQEIDKAGAAVRTQLMNDGSGPHTNAGMSDLEHITPGRNMTPEAARALTNEMITAMEYKQRRAAMAQRIQNPGTIMQELSNYDQNFDPRFFTIQRLGPQEGRAYAASHVADKAQYATSVRKMAQAQRDGKYDYGLTPDQVDRILGQKNAQ
ncbi:hypothetical protein [Gluconobacter sp. Dm-44]|uniref:hypothetical protein n=1 Tax=Gluconobacter sp. Dm-44 TaxID=2799805 RepID=UPI001B8B8A29|nr:hypothetical protein [Gluconobacter sp. Dm-44]MBS1060768.1 hypothetical protein [Gluconobacter sp. Dm-44]